MLESRRFGGGGVSGRLGRLTSVERGRTSCRRLRVGRVRSSCDRRLPPPLAAACDELLAVWRSGESSFDLPPKFWIGWGRRRQWPDCSGWSAPSPPPNRTCDFHRIRLSPGWVRPAGREHRLFRHRSRVHTSLLRRSSLRSTPIRLPTFAMWTAFPSSDYYAGSVTRPALAEGWPAPTPESRTSFPSSQRLRLHIVLGPASTPCLALCRARHRRMPVRGSTASLP